MTKEIKATEEHRERLGNLADGCNLDYIIILG